MKNTTHISLVMIDMFDKFGTAKAILNKETCDVIGGVMEGFVITGKKLRMYADDEGAIKSNLFEEYF